MVYMTEYEKYSRVILIGMVVDKILGKVSFTKGAPRALRSELHSKIVWEIFGCMKHLCKSILLILSPPREISPWYWVRGLP